MSATYPTHTLVTLDDLWTEICGVAHGSRAASEGVLEQDEGVWRLGAPASEQATAMADLFLPLLGPLPEERPLVVAHLAQSMDGRIARTDGESHWITGGDDLDHTHRLRALCDAVLVGAETVAQDDCKLTVRRCTGPQPLRIVLDPNSRVPANRSVLVDGAAPTLWVCAAGAAAPAGAGVECLERPLVDGAFLVSDLLDALHDRGIRRLFVEGGGLTVSHLLRGEALDRLHLAVAPLLMGEGRSTLSLALGDDLSSCPRPHVQVHQLGRDWLFDCDFSRESR